MPSDRHRPKGRRGRLIPALALALLTSFSLAAPALADDRTPQQLWDAARQGEMAAQLALGHYYADPESPDYEPTNAVYWYEQAMANGSGEAATELGIMLLEGDGVEPDFGQAMAALSKGVEAGNARAQYRLGTIYANGFGVEVPDAARARGLFELSAAQGYPAAQATLGVFYQQGVAGEQSDERARELFEASARAGHPLGQYHVGVMYLAGMMGEPDARTAIDWFQRAAAQGLPQANLAMAQMYMKGEGVPVSPGRARELVTLAAETGLPDAQFQLGVWYADGAFGQADESAAVFWYYRAAEQGHPDAQYLLGNHLATGRGVQKDMEMALNWLAAAARAGHPRAATRMETYLAQMKEEAAGDGAADGSGAAPEAGKTQE